MLQRLASLAFAATTAAAPALAADSPNYSISGEPIIWKSGKTPVVPGKKPKDKNDTSGTKKDGNFLRSVAQCKVRSARMQCWAYLVLRRKNELRFILLNRCVCNGNGLTFLFCFSLRFKYTCTRVFVILRFLMLTLMAFLTTIEKQNQCENTTDKDGYARSKDECLSDCQDICCTTYEQCTFGIVPRI